MRHCPLIIAVATLAVGCTMSTPPPRAEAAVVAARCGGSFDAADSSIVGPKNVDLVEPLYATVHSKPNGMESRLIGAKLHLRAIDGVTAESVGRALSCHAAGETLSGREGGDLCPYSVPGAWVDIDVKADRTGYEVRLEGRDFEGARQVLDRARAFARN